MCRKPACRYQQDHPNWWLVLAGIWMRGFELPLRQSHEDKARF